MEETQIFDDVSDLTYLQWAISRYSSGTLGSFLKSYEEDENRTPLCDNGISS